jgi:hypothetical protein
MQSRRRLWSGTHKDKGKEEGQKELAESNMTTTTTMMMMMMMMMMIALTISFQ